jgi:hypothetical protein
LLNSAPCIEFATFYGISDDFLENLKEFEARIKADGYHGMAYGETMEKLSKDGAGEKARAAVLCIGWDSKEKHMEYRESENFKANIGLLRVHNKGASVVSCMVEFGCVDMRLIWNSIMSSSLLEIKI